MVLYRLLLALEREGLDNVRVACGDAVEFLRDFVRPHTLDGVCIFFPDPWPKKRHHKRRFLREDMAAELARTLIDGGKLHVANSTGAAATSHGRMSRFRQASAHERVSTRASTITRHG